MVLKSSSLKDFLAQELEERVRRNPNYSQRAFAKSIGCSSGELSEILNEKRKVSAHTINKISSRLRLSKVEHLHLLGTISDSQEETPTAEYEIAENKFQTVAQWYHFAILNLIDQKNFVWEEKFISDQLQVSRNLIKPAMERLEKLGFVKVRNGFCEAVKDYFFSPDEISSKAIKNYHEQIFEKSKDALYEQNLEERDISGVGISISKQDVEKIKKEIKSFQDLLLKKYHREDADVVYHFESSLIRISRGVEDV